MRTEARKRTLRCRGGGGGVSGRQGEASEFCVLVAESKTALRVMGPQDGGAALRRSLRLRMLAMVMQRLGEHIPGLSHPAVAAMHMRQKLCHRLTRSCHIAGVTCTAQRRLGVHGGGGSTRHGVAGLGGAAECASCNLLIASSFPR